MSRLATQFARLQQRREKALICFVTAGDPSPEITPDLVVALGEAGADAVEIGIPFSDPLADGPSIQASSQRALDRGMTVSKALSLVRTVRERLADLPIVLMTYYNPIRQYGLDRYAADAADAGADAHIVTDLTPEEAGPWRAASAANELDTVFLLAPTSTDARIDVVSRLSTGFVYCVSRTGVTGARQDVPTDLRLVVDRIRAHTPTPICVGFGVSAPQHARAICAFADGVVVGSSLVDLIWSHRDDDEMLGAVRDYVAGLKAVTRL